MKHSLKTQGFVRTPPFIAALLTRWALRAPTDHILDAGFGEGVFLLESAKRLLTLGASAQQFAAQLHGIDSHPEAVHVLQRAFHAYRLPTHLPGVNVGDFFTADFPPVDVLIGNPPYVRRWWQKDVDALQVIAEQVPEAGQFSRLTDLACYFVIYGARFLKPGGRLALIVSDSWLNMRYGTAFKEYLLRTFHLRGMLGFQSQVFPGVLVRPVVILAEKRADAPAPDCGRVAFVSLNGRIPNAIPHDPCRMLSSTSAQASGTVVPSQELRPEDKWTPFLYTPRACLDLLRHAGMTALASLAQVRLGFQSFAKMFYIVPQATQCRWELERRWLLPLIMSPKDVAAPYLSADMPVRHYIVACDADKAQMTGTHMLRYIAHWEKQVLNPRGLARPVVGVQNLPRVGKTRRKPWYNLLPDLTRRGTAPILLPRRIYQRYQVVWNQAGWVAGENFIEALPDPALPLRPLLAILNAGTTELALRANAHVYGGGVYNLSPGTVGAVPVVDIRRLTPAVLQQLDDAYGQFLRSGGKDRTVIDTTVLAAIGMPVDFLTTLRTALHTMRGLSSAIVVPAKAAATEDSAWPAGLRLL